MKKELEGYIQIYENVIPSFVCNQIVTELEQAIWKDHSFYDPVKNTHFNNKNNLECSTTELSIQKNLSVNIKGIFNNYLQLHNFEGYSEISDHSDIAFHRYNEGAEMIQHIDHIHSIFDGSKKGVPAISMVGLLTDTFTEGKLIFFEDLEVDIRLGDVIVFPSNFLYPHRVTQVTSGTRYSFVSWAW